VNQINAVEGEKRVRKYASRYEKVGDDSEPPEVKKYKRMKMGVNALLRAHQDKVGLKRTKEVIMQLTQYGSLTNPPPMKELRRELNENEYTYEQLSMMMKSMISDSKGSEELIEVYNKHIAIIETITKRFTDDFKQKKEDKKKTRKERLEEKRVRNKPAYAKLTSPKRKYQRKKKETPYIIPKEFMIMPFEPEPELPDPSVEEIK
jgi:hypothetical protein